MKGKGKSERDTTEPQAIELYGSPLPDGGYRTMQQIADETNVSLRTIQTWFRSNKDAWTRARNQQSIASKLGNRLRSEVDNLKNIEIGGIPPDLLIVINRIISSLGALDELEAKQKKRIEEEEKPVFLDRNALFLEHLRFIFDLVAGTEAYKVLSSRYQEIITKYKEYVATQAGK